MIIVSISNNNVHHTIKKNVMQETILIIDKNTIELRKLREVLTREGFGVMTATDSAMAKQICEQISIKFILGEAEALGYGRKVK